MEVRKFNSPEEVARNFAKYLANQVDQAEKYAVALSGGSTPKLLYRILSDDLKDVIDWDHIHFFWGDERCVPPDHSDSNFGMANDLLFSNLSVELNIHRIRGEANPAEEAVKYSDQIKKNLKSVNGWPQFDMIILGMGEDGHTASIFPDQMELLNSPNICEVATHPQSGQKRITLTGEIINNARQVIFLVTGEGKADRLKEIHFQAKISDTYPATFIKPREGQLIWFLDEAAAKYL